MDEKSDRDARTRLKKDVKISIEKKRAATDIGTFGKMESIQKSVIWSVGP